MIHDQFNTQQSQWRDRSPDHDALRHYLIGLVTEMPEQRLGRQTEEGFVPNVAGVIVQRCWQAIGLHFIEVETEPCVLSERALQGVLTLRQETETLTDWVSNTAALEETRLLAVTDWLRTVSQSRISTLKAIDGSFSWKATHLERGLLDRQELAVVRQHLQAYPDSLALFDQAVTD